VYECKMRPLRVGVIPAAGQGKRLGYLGYILPKCLFPLYDRPILHHVIDNMKSSGVQEIFIIVNYQKEKIVEYIDKTRNELGVSCIRFVEQKQLTGIADAIQCVKDYVSEDFITILGDDCTESSSPLDLAETFFSNSCYALQAYIREKNIDAIRSACCITIKPNKQIVEVEEKPQNPKTRFRGCGIYIFSPKIFEYIHMTPIAPPRNEREISNTINLVAGEGRAYGEEINGVNYNINSFNDLLRASNKFKMLSKQFKDRNR